MSFILDALKKSETDRQQQSSAEFAGVPTGNSSPGVPRWLWVLGLLLAINILVLLGLFFRPDTKAPSLPPAPVTETREPALKETTLVEPATSQPSFAEQVAAAKQDAPARREPAAVLPRRPQAAPAVTPGVVYSVPPEGSKVLPTIQELRANGTLVLPELHLDIHVYSDVPNDRFVFINMSKQRESSQLAEGPVVEEITPEGVVLEYSGISFLLRRD
ncbi:MAG: general secretion pathway protein GspB [Gammaproteobacteria bacterium]|nr:general secretion pathway protein GspB [Gammaproteobacteria bacterium]MBT8111329.1 general secretion pathway protein GspB [Gammaproteobacteria bacterium]NND46088.1 GspB domain-containing protein [Woeseiaceae bacterium]NNL46027.1 GspB domain-containing protein [Woeseiaceae bacterium]